MGKAHINAQETPLFDHPISYADGPPGDGIFHCWVDAGLSLNPHIKTPPAGASHKRRKQTKGRYHRLIKQHRGDLECVF